MRELPFSICILIFVKVSAPSQPLIRICMCYCQTLVLCAFKLENGDCIIVDKGMNAFKLFTLKKQHRIMSNFILSAYFYVFWCGEKVCEGGSYLKTCPFKFFIVFLHPISTLLFSVRLSALKEIFSCVVLTDGIEHKAKCEEMK